MTHATPMKAMAEPRRMRQSKRPRLYRNPANSTVSSGDSEVSSDTSVDDTTFSAVFSAMK